MLLRRFAASYWRNPTYNGVRYTFCVILGLLLGSIYWDMGTKRCVGACACCPLSLLACLAVSCLMRTPRNS